jgi:concanavalin A-like lectin/glucanase superfamily protein/calcineurin-like phosphoesterase family protein
MDEIRKFAAAGLVAATLALIGPASAGAATCTGSTGTPYSSLVTGTAGLVSYWRLGDTAGTSACDSWGSNAGTYTGGYTLGSVGAIAGEANTAATFNGSNGYVTVPHSSSLDVGDNFSVEAWVKRASFGAPAYQAIASQGANSWMFAFLNNNTLVLRQATVGNVVSSRTTVTDTKWHHVAVTKSGASVHLYIDGVDVTGTVSNLTMANNTIPLSIGQSSSTSYWNGTLDEVALYRAALSAAQIKSHYDTGSIPPAPTPSPTDPVIGAAGDIACDPADPGYFGGNGDATRCQQRATSNLVVGTGLTGVLTLGDEQYDDATLSKFQSVYGTTWGRANQLARPAPGNHEYLTPGAAGYFDYYNGVGNQTGPAGDRSKGYYSFNLGTWHIIAINSNCSVVSCAAGSAQDAWLKADLAANHNACTLAYWHHPRFSSGQAGSNANMGTIFQDLYDANADVVLTGHDHVYERFGPQNPSAVADSARGLREFVVGTGGKSLVGWSTIKANSEVRNSSTFGVLDLTLHPNGYDWKFVPVAGQTFTDSGSTSCH